MKTLDIRCLTFLAYLAFVSSAGCGLDTGGSKERCQECTLNDDCKGELVCECVDNGETDEPFCLACVPEEYETLEGSKQDETYTCASVDEND